VRPSPWAQLSPAGPALTQRLRARSLRSTPTPDGHHQAHPYIGPASEDQCKDIRIARLCTNKPPEPTIFDVKGLHINATEGAEKEQDLFTKEEQQDNNRISATYECSHRGTCLPKVTMKEGEIAPLDASFPTMRVPSDRRKQLTHNRTSAMHEISHRGTAEDNTYQENGNCDKKVLMSAPHYQGDC
jgi:hypothetical protein